jgi:hypothetical protein
MQLNVFVTDDGSPEGTGPILFLPISPGAAMPPNPRALEWRYFATIDDEDALLAGDREAALSAIEEDGYYIANRLISVPGGRLRAVLSEQP